MPVEKLMALYKVIYELNLDDKTDLELLRRINRSLKGQIAKSK